MMKRTAVLNVVGLTPKLVGPSATRLSTWAQNAARTFIKPAFPAVTCTAQSDYLTGVYPTAHGIVGNGWYFADECEIRFWKQSNKLVQAPKIWERARAIDPSFTCANLFWWYNMYSSADYSVTPRPMYPADGRKLPDVYTAPGDLRTELQTKLGTFPLFNFWGPRASIESTKWIAESAKHVEQKFSPTLTLVYLPHLDYNLQRIGPSSPAALADVQQVDEVCGDLIAFYESRGVQVIVLSEYGLTDVSRPIHLNRRFREHGLIAVRDELGLEVLDPGASAAFAVADHQVAHVYVNDAAQRGKVRDVIEKTPGVDVVLDDVGKAGRNIDHARSGDFIAVADRDAWFTYYYWLDDQRAPDYARTVDIHRKPGYDPVELFLDPAIRMPALTVGWKLAKKTLGFRMLMDVIPLDATLVKGSHGRSDAPNDDGPFVMSRQAHLIPRTPIASVDVCRLILDHLGAGDASR
jgi:predicted AlkP superfamily pyrophosphatase or phosphodiesterase